MSWAAAAVALIGLVPAFVSGGLIGSRHPIVEDAKAARVPRFEDVFVLDKSSKKSRRVYVRNIDNISSLSRRENRVCLKEGCSFVIANFRQLSIGWKYSVSHAAYSRWRFSHIEKTELETRSVGSTIISQIVGAHEHVGSIDSPKAISEFISVAFSSQGSARCGLGAPVCDIKLKAEPLRLLSRIGPSIVQRVSGGLSGISSSPRCPSGEDQREEEPYSLDAAQYDCRLPGLLSFICGLDFNTQGILFPIMSVPAFGLIYGGSFYGLFGRRRQWLGWLGSSLGMVLLLGIVWVILSL